MDQVAIQGVKHKTVSSFRVFIGLSEVAGYFGALACGLEKAGAKTNFVKLYDNPFAFRSKPCAIEPVIALYRRFGTMKRKRTGLARFVGFAAMVLLKPFIFIWAVLFHDVFIFSFFATFYNYHELRLLKLLGKKIVYVFLGSDARPAYLSGIEIIHNAPDKSNICSRQNLERIYNLTYKQSLRMQKVERFADFIINHPTTAQLNKKPFITLLASGFATMAGPHADTLPEKQNPTEIRIVHAPSLPEIKGSDKIREIVNKLKKTVPGVTLEELVKVPHEKVLETLAGCDFVIDEVYSDNPLGGLGVEAAMFSKPVISGGYYAKNIKADHPENRIPPSKFVLPEKIYDAALELATAPAYRQELGRRAHDFVMENWSPQKVGLRYCRMLEGSAPQHWFYNPLENKNINGYGINENELKNFLTAYMKLFSTKGLFADHNPELIEKILEFTEGSQPKGS